MTRRLVLLMIAAVLAGCSPGGEAEPSRDEPVESADGDGSVDGEPEPGRTDVPPDPPPPSPPEPPCRLGELAVEPLELTGPDGIEVAQLVAERTHRCAAVVVVAPDDPWVASLAAAVAHAADAPLLLVDPAVPDALASTLSQLETDELVTVGLELAAFGLPGTELLADTNLDLAVRVAEHLGTDRFLAVAQDDPETRAAALARLAPDLALLPLPAELDQLTTALPPAARLEVLTDEVDAGATVEQLNGLGLDAAVAPEPDELWAPALDAVAADGLTWLADPTDGAATAVTAVAAAGRREALLPVDGADLRSGRERTDRLRRAELGDVVVVGSVTDQADWQLTTVLDGQPLPGGGFRLFEDERMVALYGSVETTALGVLGEQGIDGSVERVRTVSAPYGADGVRVLPAFEIIVTTASATEQPTGDYSRRTAIDLLRPWVDRAAEEGIYVFLDLQSGRTDFLTQAKEYEELLREPHVGLALDPEWRLEPDEFHLRQIGSVDAAEVQEVADWLAALTREARLPEKLLVLHQFTFSMLPDRDTIVAPPELAVVVHMDGQGALATKYQTYDAITRGVEDRWLWGWKNFYDEDFPTPTPEQVLELDPLPVLVTYQ